MATTRRQRRTIFWHGTALAAVLWLAGFSAAAGAAKPARPRLRIPKLATAPTIDGTMADGEWGRAAAVSGFIGATGSFGKVMVPKQARIYLAHANETFYLAVWTQLAPGEKPTMRYRKRDDKVFMDRQQFELWLTPPTDGHVTAYQLIGNAYGAMYDMKHQPALGVQQPGWNPQWEFQNAYKVGEWWTAEFAIPFSELIDEDGYNPELPWGGMVAVAWPQRSWPFTHGWYKNIETHAQMVMGTGGTCVRILDMDSLLDNRFTPDLELVNDTDAVGDFALTLRADGKTIEKSYRVPAGAVYPVRLDEALPAATAKVNTVHLTVRGPGGEELVDGDWMYRPMEVKEREVAPIEEKPWSMVTRVNYAPLARGVYCWADLLDVPMCDEVAKATFTVSAPDGTEVLSGEDAEFQYDSAERYLWLPEDLAPGAYTVTTRFVDDAGQELASSDQTFQHKDFRQEFVWLDSDKYGEKLTVAAPWTALETTGRSFGVWGRTYAMDGALPAAIESQEEALLVGPVTFVAEQNGKAIAATVADGFALDGKPDENRAAWTGSYTLAGLELKLAGSILFDGGILYNLEATPQGAQEQAVDRLYLSIPVREEVARYLWSTRGSAGSSHAFLSDLPAEGVIWTSEGVADFVPYLGLADDDRALQWFADNDHEWILGDDAPCAQVVRRDGVVEMQINLVRRAGGAGAFQARFGLIATPVKPLPEGWRNAWLHFGNTLGSKVPFFYHNGHGKVGPFDWHDSAALAAANGIEVPEGEDAARVLDCVDGKGYPDYAAIAEAYDQEEASRVKGLVESTTKPQAVRHCYFHNAQMYFEGNKSKAFRTFFKGDWSLVPSSGWFHLRPVESYQDFFCFHLTQFLKFWYVSGMYFDETYFAPDYNVFNGQGKEMPDGTVRPSVGITLQRRFLHRVRQCCLDQGVDPFLWVHTSNYMAPYAISAVDIAMFGEDNIPTPQKDIIDVITPQYMRILGRTQKFGFVPVWMTMAGRGGLQWGLAGRQTFGWCWLHDNVPEVHTHTRGWPQADLRNQWGIAENDVEFAGYWQNRDLVQPADGAFKASLWTRPHPEVEGRQKVMMIVLNKHYVKDGTTRTVLTIDPAKLGLPANWKAYAMESLPAIAAREAALTRAEADHRQGKKFARNTLAEEYGVGRNLQFWKVRTLTDEQRKLDPEKLTVLSDSEGTFAVEMPARDFTLIMIE